MWLKYLNCTDQFNVETEEAMEKEELMNPDSKYSRNPLELFKKLTALKQFRAIQDGNVFYPWQDQDIFTFLRYNNHSSDGFSDNKVLLAIR